MSRKSPAFAAAPPTTAQRLRSEAWLLRGISSIPGELILAHGVLCFVAHDTGSAWPWQLRKLEDEMQALGFAAAMGRGEGFCLLQWQANALQAWAPWYYFGGGIRLKHRGLVLCFSLGRPANMALRAHAGGPGAVGELRRQWLAIRGMRSRGRHWLAALAHERVGHGATGSRCYGQA